MKFAGICIITENVWSLATFYSEILQAQIDGDDVHSFIKVPGAQLTILSKKVAENELGFDFTQHSGSGKISIVFNVDDVDIEYERIEKMDVEFVKRPTTYPWGFREMQIRDLDGNIVSFVRKC